MADVDGREVLLLTMGTVTFTAMRCEVMSTLASLCDRPYQERVWLNKEYPSANYYDSFTLAVSILYDDTEVLPRPEKSVASVLVAGEEVERLAVLGCLLDELIDRLGDVDDARYVSDPAWGDVLAAASAALAAMVRAWGLPWG